MTALLEVTDLEEFRNQAAALANEIAAPADPLIEKLEIAAGIAGAGRLVKPLLAKVPAPAPDASLADSVTVLVALVPSLAATVAPAIGAPVESTTVPVMLPSPLRRSSTKVRPRKAVIVVSSVAASSRTSRFHAMKNSSISVWVKTMIIITGPGIYSSDAKMQPTVTAWKKPPTMPLLRAGRSAKSFLPARRQKAQKASMRVPVVSSIIKLALAPSA